MTSSNWNIFRGTGLCAGNSTVTGEFSSQRPVTGSFDVFFDLHLNTLLSKQLWGWRFEMSSHSLWHYCNVQIACRYLQNTEKLANWLCSMKTPHDVILWKWYYQSHLSCHHEKSWFLFCFIIMHPILVYKIIQAFDSGGTSQINKYIF